MTLKSGDVIGFAGWGVLSDVINLLTFGLPRYSVSHVGIVCDDKLYESTSKRGVTATNLQKRLKSYGGRVYHYELPRPLYEHESERLRSFLDEQLGKDYDTKGAFKSGGLVIAVISRFLRRQDLTTLFCSELVAGALQNVGILAIKHSGYNPNRLTRMLYRVCTVSRLR
jgi:hypothetical protein